MVDSGRERMVRIVGERYADCGFSTFDVGKDRYTPVRRKVKDKVCEYADKIAENMAAGRNLILMGSVGTGKDHLAAAVVRTIVGRGFTVAFVMGSVLADEMLASIKGDEPLNPKYGERDFLVISDIEPRGEDPPPPTYQTSILRLLDERYRMKRPTIITSNRNNRQEIHDVIGKRAIDRLYECILEVPMQWPSYRPEARHG